MSLTVTPFTPESTAKTLANLQDLLAVGLDHEERLTQSVQLHGENLQTLQQQADTLQNTLLAYQGSIASLQTQVSALPNLQVDIHSLQQALAEISAILRCILAEIAQRS